MDERVWHRVYDPGVPREIEVPPFTLPDLLRRTADAHPDRTAIVFRDVRWTWAELARQAGKVAALLRDLGVKPDDRVALLFPNVPHEVACYYGALMAGAVVVQINPLGNPKEMAHALKDSGATVLIALDALLGKFMDGLAGAPVRHVLVSRLGEFLPFKLQAALAVAHWLGKAPLPPRGTGEDLSTRLAAVEPAPASPRTPDDLALLQYTGGTTGLPKAAMLTHRNLVANTEQCRAWLNRPDGVEVTLLAVPCFHVYGMTVGMNLAVRTGGTMVLMARWDPATAMENIARHRPTQFPGVQVFYQQIAAHRRVKDYDLSSIKACLSGAGPLMQEVQDKFEALTGARVSEGYGLTEASPVTHCNPLAGRRKPGHIGVPLSSTDAKLVDIETGTKVVGVGQEGELCVQGPQVMKGYWNQPGETAAVLRDGWLHTGDIAVMDEEGFFRIVDRKKEMIKSAGENVYPRDIEEVLFKHPAVKDAAAIGVPDAKYGELVKAFVVLKEGATATAEELIAHCRASLSGFQTPKAVEFRKELPRTQVGKLLRRVLVEEEKDKRKGGGS